MEYLLFASGHELRLQRPVTLYSFLQKFCVCILHITIQTHTHFSLRITRNRSIVSLPDSKGILFENLLDITSRSYYSCKSLNCNLLIMKAKFMSDFEIDCNAYMPEMSLSFHLRVVSTVSFTIYRERYRFFYLIAAHKRSSTLRFSMSSVCSSQCLPLQASHQHNPKARLRFGSLSSNQEYGFCYGGIYFLFSASTSSNLISLGNKMFFPVYNLMDPPQHKNGILSAYGTIKMQNRSSTENSLT